MTGEGKHCTESEGAGMKEYIERVAIHELVNGLPKYQMFNYDRTKSLIGINPDDVDFGVDKMPAADVVEVRHGRWIPSDMGGGEPDEAYICSECGEPWVLNDGTPEENNMRYCPACGARMDKEDEHEAD